MQRNIIEVDLIYIQTKPLIEFDKNHLARRKCVFSILHIILPIKKKIPANKVTETYCEMNLTINLSCVCHTRPLTHLNQVKPENVIPAHTLTK